MASRKLKKLEEVLADFKERYLFVKTERDGLKAEVDDLKERVGKLKEERFEVRKKVGSLLSLSKDIGV